MAPDIQAAVEASGFGLSFTSLLFVVFASWVVGYVCLTYYYNMIQKNAEWKGLTSLDKSAFGALVGFCTILTMAFLFLPINLLWKLPSIHPFVQIQYLSPFLYFIFYYIIECKALKQKSEHLDFIKHYLTFTTLLLLMLALGVLVFLVFSIGNWIFGFILLAFFLVVIWNMKRTLQITIDK